jgi:hypothetical protein
MVTVTLSKNTTNKMVCLENIVYVVNILKSVLITLDFNVIKELQSFVSVNTSFYGP